MENKVLIIGADGMLGHDLVDAFSDHNLVAWDKKEIDITDEKQVMEKIGQLNPALIINAAAYTDVDKAETEEDLAMAVNATGVLNLALAAKAVSAILVHYSTESVFDGRKKEGYKELDQTSPVNVYGRSKTRGEELLQNNYDKFYIIRSSWLYGKAPQKGKARGLNFVETMLKLAKERDEINVVNDQFGKPTWTHDLAIMSKELIKEMRPYGIYHITNEGECSWYDFAKKIFELSNINIKVNPISSEEYEFKTPRPKSSVLLNTKFDQLRSWQEALAEYLKLP